MSFDISRYRVLLAHADGVVRTRLQAMLQAADIEAVPVADGLQAWRALNATPEHYDAILLDRGLSGISAAEFVRRLRDSAATAALPALFLNGTELTATDAPSGSAPAPGCRLRPPDAGDLLGTLTVAIEDYRARLDRAS